MRQGVKEARDWKMSQWRSGVQVSANQIDMASEGQVGHGPA